MDDTLSFPPLLRGQAATAGEDPFAAAQDAARAGTDPGLVVYRADPFRLDAAIVLAPETPLRDAMAMVMAAQSAMADALGALAPPEVAVHFDWPGGLRVNGAVCGSVRAAAAHRDPEAEPDWLVLAVTVPFVDDSGIAPGDRPDHTVLAEEGCGDVHPCELIESWSRHLLTWIHRWSEDGMAPLHADWRGRAHGIGKEVAVMGRKGRFVGLDEAGGMLLGTETGTALLPLTLMLED